MVVSLNPGTAEKLNSLTYSPRSISYLCVAAELRALGRLGLPDRSFRLAKQAELIEGRT